MRRHHLPLVLTVIAGCQAAHRQPSEQPSAVPHTQSVPASLVGRYYRGDGLGCNINLELLSDGQYRADWHGSLGCHGKAAGQWRCIDDVLVFTPSSETKELIGHLRELRVVNIAEGIALVPNGKDGDLFDKYGASRFSCYQRVATSADGITPCDESTGEAPKLAIGDKAPPLQIEKWTRGSGPDEFRPDAIYVLAFWSVSDLKGMLSTNELYRIQEEYKTRGVVVVHVTFDESGALPDADVVAEDDSEDGDAYAIGWDNLGRTLNSYPKAAGVESLPVTFVVDRSGRVAWFGNLMYVRLVLDRVVDQTWDYQTGPELAQRAEVARSRFLGFAIAADYAGAAEAFRQLEPEFPSIADGLANFQIKALLKTGQFAEALDTAKKVVDHATAIQDVSRLQSVATTILDEEAPDAEINKLALRIAEMNILGDQNEDQLSLLAHAHFMNGNVAKAIDLQRKAIQLAPEFSKEMHQTILEKYERSARPDVDVNP